MKDILMVIIVVIMAVNCQAQENIKWIDAKTLRIEGKGWNDTQNYFDRLPSKAKELAPSIWWGANNNAGMAIRFSTNSTKLIAKWTLISSPYVMTHQAATGSSGLDLYLRTSENTWRFMAVGRPKDTITNEITFFSGNSNAQRTFLLYLPLYNGVSSLELGIDNDASFKIVEPDKKKQIVVYGTSIVQGGCASRPGMVYTSIIGRWLDCEVINLGFSGSAHMEPAVSDLLAELDPGLYIIDALPNMYKDPITERTLYLVRTIRKARPNTPIILVENAYPVMDNAKIAPTKENAKLKAAYDQLIQEKTTGLFYLEGKNLVGNDNEGTVDGTHPTDLGFMRMAEIIYKAAKDALTPKIPKGKLKTSVPNF